MVQKCKKFFVTCVALLLSIFFVGESLSGVAHAIDWNREFIEYHGLNNITNAAKSPFRASDDNNADVWSNVNSNNNQPRYINSSGDLHNATDLRGSAGTKVYSIHDNGVIQAISQPGTVNNGYVTVRYTINGSYYYVKIN